MTSHGREEGYLDPAETAAIIEASWYRDPPRLAGGDAEAVRAILRREGIAHVCHVAPARHLPQIARDGGLMPSYAASYLRAESIETSPTRDVYRCGWSRAYVFFSFLPAWYLCRLREELVIVLVRAEAVCLQRDALFAHDQSVTAEMMDQHSWHRSRRIAALEMCFGVKGPSPRAEIAAGRVSLSGFEAIVFCDGEAQQYWWDRFLASSLARADGRRIDSAISPRGRFAFPPDFVPTIRHR